MKKVTRQDLIVEFNRLAEKLDKRPTLSEFNEHGEYSQTPVYKQFDSFEALKDAAGFETGEQRVTDDSLCEDIRRVKREIGRSPPIEVYREKGDYNPKTLKRRFGSWHDVLEEAGVGATEHSEHWKDVGYTDKKDGTIMVDCAYCGDDVPRQPNELKNRKNIFCGPKCKGGFMSTQTGEEARSWGGGMVQITCERCGDTRNVRPAEVDNARFCSQDCMIKWRSEEFSGENHPRFVENGEWRYYGPNWEDQAEKARSRDNHECQICGLTNEQSQKKWGEALAVHHIVRFYDFDSYKTANQLENLLTACKQHHTLLDLGKIQPSKERVTRLNEWLAQLSPDEQPQSE